MFLSLQSIFFIIPKYVFYASYSMFFFSRGACFLLICCMFYFSTFVTYPLHVIYFCTACYFSRMYSFFSRIYQSSLFFCSRIPSPPVFPYRSSRRDHCFLHGCPSFALPLNPSLKRIYAAAPSTRFFPSVLLVACYYIYSVRGLDRRT
jgi:hypothetical protein